jgi:hypothetical protein
MRKVNHDATFSLENILYETEQRLANTRVEVRYEPEWLENPARPVFLYQDGLKIGEARQVNFFANAQLKRKGAGRPPQKNLPISSEEETPPHLETPLPSPSLSFAELVERGKDDSPDPVRGDK